MTNTDTINAKGWRVWVRGATGGLEPTDADADHVDVFDYRADALDALRRRMTAGAESRR